MIDPVVVADSSAFRIRSIAPLPEKMTAVVPVSVFVSVTTVPSALRAVTVSVCVVSPAALESASTVSPAVTCVKSGRRSVSIAPPTATPSVSDCVAAW